MQHPKNSLALTITITESNWKKIFFFLKMQQHYLKYMPASPSSSHTFMQSKFYTADKLHFTTTTFTTTTNAGAFEEILVFYKVSVIILIVHESIFQVLLTVKDHILN